jgi:hypothetical protein
MQSLLHFGCLLVYYDCLKLSCLVVFILQFMSHIGGRQLLTEFSGSVRSLHQYVYFIPAVLSCEFLLHALSYYLNLVLLLFIDVYLLLRKDLLDFV